MNKSATKREKWYMEKVAALGCLICNSAAQIHHINSGKNRMGHVFVLPLCPYHHEGPRCSIGNHKKLFTSTYGSELGLMMGLRNELVLVYGDIFRDIFALQDARLNDGKLKYII